MTHNKINKDEILILKRLRKRLLTDLMDKSLRADIQHAVDIIELLISNNNTVLEINESLMTVMEQVFNGMMEQALKNVGEETANSEGKQDD